MALKKRCLGLLSLFSPNICVNSGQIVLANNNVTTVTSCFCLLFPTRAKTLQNIVPVFPISACKMCFFPVIFAAKMNSQLEHRNLNMAASSTFFMPAHLSTIKAFIHCTSNTVFCPDMLVWLPDSTVLISCSTGHLRSCFTVLNFQTWLLFRAELGLGAKLALRQLSDT